MDLSRRVIPIFLLIIATTLAINFIRSWIHLNSRGDIIEQARIRLEKKEAERDGLERKFAGIKSAPYIETQAREKLNLARPGEVVILLPPTTPVTPISIPIDHRANWEKWVDLFL